MTTNNWRQELIDIYCKNNAKNSLDFRGRNLYIPKYLDSFIETKIALARKEGAEEKEKEIIDSICDKELGLLKMRGLKKLLNIPL